MWLSIIAFLCVSVAVAGLSAPLPTFEEFVAKYGKTYPTAAEGELRRTVFQASLLRIKELNARNETAGRNVFGVNTYSDRTPEEFKVFHSLKKRAAPQTPKKYDPNFQAKASFPNAWDWRAHGAVTPIKNQQQCGSCWAFSAVGSFEGAWFLAGHPLASLSEQEIVSCDPDDSGCDGGDPGTAYSWLVNRKSGYITSESDYPYTSGGGDTGYCRLPKPPVAQMYAHYDIASSEQTMAAYLQLHGPLSICVDANAWQDYSGGILRGCGMNVDHCVTAVGYNLNNNPPYWIVKNSWGSDWGYSGYIYIEYGRNECDLNSEPRVPLVHAA